MSKYNIAVYTFKIEVKGLEEKIWRSIEILSTSNVARIAYTVLASFQTAMYHLYNISYKGKRYDSMIEAADYYGAEKLIDARKVRLYELDLIVNDELTMTYDYGVDWEFRIILTNIRNMENDSKIVDYPKIVDGAGYGIIEDRHYSDARKIIEAIDKTGKVTEYALTLSGKMKKWDYRRYDLAVDNDTLKERLYAAIVAYEELTDIK